MIFFANKIFFHRHWRFTGQLGKGGDHLLFRSTTSAHSLTSRHLFATLHVRWLPLFLIASLITIRLLLGEIYHLIELPFWLIDDTVLICFICVRDDLFDYSNLTRETDGFELASTITLVLQANRLNKCASQKAEDSFTGKFHNSISSKKKFQKFCNKIKLFSVSVWIFFLKSASFLQELRNFLIQLKLHKTVVIRNNDGNFLKYFS